MAVISLGRHDEVLLPGVHRGPLGVQQVTDGEVEDLLGGRDSRRGPLGRRSPTGWPWCTR